MSAIAFNISDKKSSDISLIFNSFDHENEMLIEIENNYGIDSENLIYMSTETVDALIEFLTEKRKLLRNKNA